MALTIARLPPHPSQSLVHLVATAAPRRERIASSRSIVHYEKQKCTARQWRDPRSASNNRPNYIRSLAPYLFPALYPAANDAEYVAGGVQRENVRDRTGDEG